MIFSNLKIVRDYLHIQQGLLTRFCYLGAFLSQIVFVSLSNRTVLCPGDKLQVCLCTAELFFL